MADKGKDASNGHLQLRNEEVTARWRCGKALRKIIEDQQEQMEV